MVHKIERKEQAWKKSLRAVADNPDWIFENMNAIEKELKYDNPNISYLREKHAHIGEWIDEIEKFHSRKGFTVGDFPQKNVKIKVIKDLKNW